MNQTISETGDNDCGHKNSITISGKLVCQECGLEVGEAFSDIFYSNGKLLTDITEKERYVKNLGSKIYLNKFDVDYVNDIGTFRRLKQMSINHRSKENQRLYQSFIILNNIGNYLKIPKVILDDSAIRFKKITKSGINIINRVSCLCFCLWDSIRHFKHKTCLKELLNAFNKMGHRVNKRLMIRDGTIYREVLYREGMEKTSPKTMRDYISRNIGELRNNHDYITKRLKIKKLHIPTHIYISEIESLSYNIIDKMNNHFLYKSFNPHEASVSCVYFAARVISKKNNKMTIITQKDLSDITGVPLFCLRAIFADNFKPLL